MERHPFLVSSFLLRKFCLQPINPCRNTKDLYNYIYIYSYIEEEEEEEEEEGQEEEEGKEEEEEEEKGQEEGGGGGRGGAGGGRGGAGGGGGGRKGGGGGREGEEEEDEEEEEEEDKGQEEEEDRGRRRRRGKKTRRRRRRMSRRKSRRRKKRRRRRREGGGDIIAERSEVLNQGSIFMCVRMCLSCLGMSRGDVTQECRCVTFAGLGILRILRVKGHIIVQNEGGAWERMPQAGAFSHGGGEGRCTAFSEA